MEQNANLWRVMGARFLTITEVTYNEKGERPIRKNTEILDCN